VGGTGAFSPVVGWDDRVILQQGIRRLGHRRPHADKPPDLRPRNPRPREPPDGGIRDGLDGSNPPLPSGQNRSLGLGSGETFRDIARALLPSAIASIGVRPLFGASSVSFSPFASKVSHLSGPLAAFPAPAP